jgi:hypothetical protein
MTVRLLNTSPMPPMSERAEALIPAVEELLKRVRSGELRSLAWVGVSEDGTSTPTFWDLEDGDSLKVIFAILQTDIITSRTDD